MKIKNITGMVLCAVLIGSAVYARENISVSTENVQAPVKEDQAPVHDGMPYGEAPPEFSQWNENSDQERGPRGRRFGRGQAFGNMQMPHADPPSEDSNTGTTENSSGGQPEGNMQEGFGGRGGKIMQPAGQNNQQTNQEEEKSARYNLTYLSSVLLLIAGFIFAKFYKRKTF